MADVYLVGGIANNAVKDMFKSSKEVRVIGTFSDLTHLTEEVIQKGISFLYNARAVLIIDYGFSKEHYIDRAKEFVLLQDALHSSNLTHTKLYLVTKDTNLYHALEHQEGGLPGILYRHAEVFLKKGDYVVKVLEDVIRGSHDNTGLYHPDALRETKITRMEDDRDKFIEDSRTVDKDILRYGVDEPINPFSNRDYVDSPQRQAEAAKREAKSKSKKQTTQKKVEKEVVPPPKEKEHPPSNSKEIPLKIQTPKKVDIAPRNIAEVVQNVQGVNISLMKETFQRRMQDTVLSEKLAQDKGVLFFTGIPKSGTSGVLANCADIYTLNKRKVLIVDLDCDNRMQLNYFPSYISQVDKQQGVGNSLMQVFKGGALATNVVKLTSQLDMLALSPTEVLSVDWWDTLEEGLYPLLEEAKGIYDLVLVDIPFHFIPACVDAMPLVDKYVVTTSNKHYELEALFNRIVPQLAPQIGEDMYMMFLRKSIIWVNQFRSHHVDGSGAGINRVWIRQFLHRKGHPFDKVQIAGESPFYENWETQFTAGKRYIWADKLALGVFQQLLTKVVW